MIGAVMGKKRENVDGISDEGLATVKRIVAELEALQNAETLDKTEYKRLRKEAKKAAGKAWIDVAESIENFAP
jgi:hypothetical protein